MAAIGSRARRAIVALAGVVSLLGVTPGTARATTAYYVSKVDVYVRPRPQSYAMGRLYTDERIDIQYIDSNGWGYGYAYGNVNRCIWVQFSLNGVSNFWTHGTSVTTKCRTTNMYLADSEFTNGEIWSNAAGTDGVVKTLPRGTYAWDNWAWNSAWGAPNYRGSYGPNSVWKVRYTTTDGVGVMARPCAYDATGTLSCSSDWQFIQRSSF